MRPAENGGSSDVHLLIEVADSSRDLDQRKKIPLYARAGIPEVWLVDLIDDALIVYRDPKAHGYCSVTVTHRGESIAMFAFPDERFALRHAAGEHR